MNLHLLTVGKPARGPLADASTDYAKRLGRHVSLRERWVRSAHGAYGRDELRRRESQALRDALPQQAMLVVLDERGERPGSVELARRIAHVRDNGTRELALCIGGAHGHDEALRSHASWVWSLSPLTFPHEIARLLVLEQLYRAFTILAGEPYHKA